ncbi:alkyldihydroxyacetonephosphate synthase, peroxisomal-like [Dysidea avara]|uniref:alkyldihydroxyacetonephosphate synthase, peroxisomal-like n=1 Tax=Dysidea avara TaxID=196820 RepID=UPI00331E5A51
MTEKADRRVMMQPCKAQETSAPISSSKVEVQKAFPIKREEVLKWNGWGYRDSGFVVNDKGNIEFTGKGRYTLSGTELHKFKPYLEETFNFDTTLKTFSQPPPDLSAVPKIVPHRLFVDAVRPHCVKISEDSMDRLVHSHGHTCHELFSLRTGNFGRFPDYVVWPGSHSDVEKIVSLAVKHNVCVIPFGGGTNVSGALECPEEERRTIVSLDMTQMDKILWIDEENLTVHVEAGIVGQDLERQLTERGFCTGHEPDSQEFSTVGGWVATRSSGMKKNVYGNIEDLVVRMRMVTPQGTIEKSSQGPRTSIGPDIHHFILGSEGILGVITEVTMKIRPLPEMRKYGSVVFANFESGVGFVREVAKQRCAPASIRLMDNDQFLLGQAMSPASSLWKSFTDKLKLVYLTRFKGYEVDKIAACTLLLEGTAAEVSTQEQRLYSIAAKYGGIPGGEENGKKGYMLTFVIAYIRDMGFDYSFLGESFETSVPWDRVINLRRNVIDRIKRECERLGVRASPIISARVTQTYDAGACMYFYFGFKYAGLGDPVHVYEQIEAAARDEILAGGGSLSHHHGVGKIRKRWLKDSLSDTGVKMLEAVKKELDPQNIFGCRNLLQSKL